MRRVGFALTLAALITGTALAATLPAAAGARSAVHPETCRYSRSDGHRGWSADEVERTIRCAVRRWPVAGGAEFAISVASCESGLNERAVSSSGTFRGVFQQHAGYWPGRFRALAPRRFDLRPSPLNGRTNVVVSIKMAHIGGWGPWSCA